MMEPDPDTFPSVPGFQPLRLLGRGGMGDVYLARALDTDRPVALKLLATPTPERLREQERRFEREAGLVRQFDHPNLVPVLDHGDAGGRHYFVMEYVEGRPLRELLTPGQPLDPGRARELLAQIADALAYLDGRGVVHRDLKPENVLVQSDGRARVTDFGIAVTADDAGALTRTDQLLGTPDYMAPEQRAGLALDGRADQFSLAVLAYEMLTGRRPVGHFKPASRLNPRLPAAVDAFLTRGLNEDPAERFPTTRAFADALDTALARRPASRLPVAFGGAAVLLLVTVGAWFVVRPLAATPTAPEPAPAAPPERDPRHADLVREGDLLSARRLRDDAIKRYTEALALVPDDPVVLTKRAHEYKLTRRAKEARADLEAALRLNANHAEARVGLGSLFMQENDYRRAVSEFDAALAADPRHALAMANRGYCRRRLGDEAAGLRDLDRAIELDNRCGLAYHYRGIIRSAKKDYEGAVADFRASVDCTPDNPFAHSALASLLAECPEQRHRDPAAAVRHAGEACKLTEFREWRELRTLAAAHAAAGDLDEAIVWAEKALTVIPAGRDRDAMQTRLDGYRRRREPIP